MSTLEEVRSILAQTLQLGEKAEALEPSTLLLGSIPELDSMAVVAVITGLEERFDITVEDQRRDLRDGGESLQFRRKQSLGSGFPNG